MLQPSMCTCTHTHTHSHPTDTKVSSNNTCYFYMVHTIFFYSIILLFHSIYFILFHSILFIFKNTKQDPTTYFSALWLISHLCFDMIYCGIQTRSPITTDNLDRFEAQGRGRKKVLVHLQEEGNLSSQKRSLGRKIRKGHLEEITIRNQPQNLGEISTVSKG